MQLKVLVVAKPDAGSFGTANARAAASSRSTGRCSAVSIPNVVQVLDPNVDGVHIDVCAVAAIIILINNGQDFCAF